MDAYTLERVQASMQLPTTQRNGFNLYQAKKLGIAQVAGCSGPWPGYILYFKNPNLLFEALKEAWWLTTPWRRPTFVNLFQRVLGKILRCRHPLFGAVTHYLDYKATYLIMNMYLGHLISIIIKILSLQCLFQYTCQHPHTSSYSQLQGKVLFIKTILYVVIKLVNYAMLKYKRLTEAFSRLVPIDISYNLSRYVYHKINIKTHNF